ncbi:MAG: hypothetical protein C4574_03555 [Candidatus Latescibacterota bacterium]|jgi:hypothetical protein|nr:MAG: hypothetical protein C4574_03555 [Candidatus Latescibacterota bacterium]
MSPRENGRSGIYGFAKRVLEGRVSPLQFIVLLGSFSTLVLLYISLHVCFFNVSTEIADESERLEALMERNVRLMSRYNELAAPARIIPLARGLGMRPGSNDDVERLAVSGDPKAYGEPSWAEAGIDRLLEFVPSREARMAR